MAQRQTAGPRSGSTRAYAPWALAVLPLAYLIAVVARYRLDFPYLDQWEFVPFLAKSYAGTLTFGDFWAQHNEHRILLPRIVMLLLARASHWNVGWELACNIVLATAVFCALTSLVRRTARAVDAPPPRWVVPLISLLVFSVSQWENWFFGWQLTELLNMASVVFGLLLIASPRCGRWGFAAGLLLGIIASYSFANGLLYWPVGAAVLLTAPGGLENRGKRLALWAAVGAAAWAAYFCGYRAPDYHPSVWLVFRHPVEFALYVLTYLGAPVANFNNVAAAAAGLAALVVLALCVFRLLETRRVPLGVLAPYLGLALYAVGCAALTGAGRIGFGSGQAMSPRYILFANLLWFADIALGVLVLERPPSEGRTRRDWRGRMIGAGLACLLVFCSLYGTYRWTERYHYRLPARDTLLSGDDLDMLRRLHPEPEKIIERRPVLQECGLSIFRGPH